MNRQWQWVLALGAAAWCGCGDKSAVQKCDDFLGTLCDRAISCSGGSAAMRATCVQELQTSVSCGAAKKVSATYDRCMTQLKTIDCSILFTTDPQGKVTSHPPADCTGAILTFEPGETTRSTMFDGLGSVVKVDPSVEPDDL